MNALRAVPAPDDPDAMTYADLTSAPEEIDGGTAFEPATDPEALLLCAMMWTHRTGGDTTEIQRITDTLAVADFDDIGYGRLFAVLAELVSGDRPHDPASVTDALIRSGAHGAKDAPLRRRLNGVITAGAEALLITHYADIVLSQSYRRSFRRVGTAITDAAGQLPEEDLFEHMLEHGRRQRAAFHRLNTFRSVRIGGRSGA